MREEKRLNELNNQGGGSPVKKRKIISVLVLIVLIIVNVYEYFLGSMSIRYYGNNPNAVLEGGDWYRVFTHMFIHVDLRHLVMNCFALMVIGMDLAEKSSPIYILSIYITGGIAAAFASIGWAVFVTGTRDVYSVGASGAVYALLGGVFAGKLVKLLTLKARGDRSLIIHDTLYLIIVAVVLLTARPDENVDMAAHAGGFIWGVFLSLILSLTGSLKY